MWRSFARLLTQFDRKKLEPSIALRNAIGVGLPLAVGVAIGMPLGGLAVASGALQVAYSDGHDPYSRRGFRMVTSTVLCALAVVVGGLSGHSPILATIAVVVWGFASGLVVLLGSDAESLGVISLVTLIIYAAQALSVPRALNAGMLALGGGFLQTTLSVLLWPLSRREPERRALAALYFELSRSAAAAGMKSQHPPPSAAEMTAAQDALRRLGRNPDSESQRLWSLLNQAERIRLSLLTLGRLRNRVARQAGQSSDLQLLGQFLQVCSDILRGIAITIVTHKVSSSPREALRALQQLGERYRALETNPEAPFLPAMRRAIRHQFDAIAGQLRSAFRIAANQLLAAEPLPNEEVPTWISRAREDLSILLANLSSQSAGFRHAVRLSATLAVGEVMAHAINARRSYWLPMTISLVLKPEFTVTFSRGLLRIGGTIAGLMLSTALFHFLHPLLGMEVVLVAIFVFLVRWIGPANYGIFAINVSALVVLLVSFTGVAPKDAILTRGIMTTLGGVTALAAYAIWPTWEAMRSSEVLARMLDAYRIYFRAVTNKYIDANSVPNSDLDRARLEARRTRSSLEASLDRLRLEPVANAQDIEVLNTILASSHRFINATMALEGAHEKNAVADADALHRFCSAVDQNLAMLITGLRNREISLRSRPNLREAHNAFLSTIGSHDYTLLGDETDRITNSLNTLVEQVLNWRGLKQTAETPAPSPVPV